MTRYLQTLLAQARGAAPEIKPRIRSRFEPGETATPDILPENFGASDRIEPPSAPIRLAPLAPTSPPGDLLQASSGPKPTPWIDREIIRQIHEHSDRVERIEHRISERDLSRTPFLAAPERTVIVERPPYPATLTDPHDTKDRLAETAPQPHQPVSAPLPSHRNIDAAEAAPTLRSEEPPTAAKSPSPSLSRAPDFTPARREPTERLENSAAPEITITIGVLDIRLTQDAPAERRPSTPAQNRPDNTLPLADYLAKRSGGAP